MDTELEPIDVAAHWPFLRRHLDLHRRRSLERVLDHLAELQVDAGGIPVPLGVRSLVQAGRANGRGDATASLRALREAEEQRVVWRYRGGGCRPDGWSFRPSLLHWREAPWTRSARDLATVVGACTCATFRAVARQNAGQSVGLPRQFWLPASDHTRPPGLFPVDLARYRAKKRATARRPGPNPVDMSRYRADLGAPLLSSVDDYVVNVSGDVDVETITILRRAIREACGGATLWARSEADRRLVALAGELSVEQAEALGPRLVAYRVSGRPIRSPVFAVQVLEDLARAPDVLGLAGWQDRWPSGPVA